MKRKRNVRYMVGLPEDLTISVKLGKVTLKDGWYVTPHGGCANSHTFRNQRQLDRFLRNPLLPAGIRVERYFRRKGKYYVEGFTTKAKNI